jgi:CheY-like chemotaxis protein
MQGEDERRQAILVLHDDDETLCLMGKMLGGEGCHITMARNEEDAVARACSDPPDLILMSLGLDLMEHLLTAQQIRKRIDFGGNVAIVLFCVSTIPEGAEVEVDGNIYAIRPDNFDQLRAFLNRLLLEHHPSTC